MQEIYEVRIKGKGGHASMPQKAENPILSAAELIRQMCEEEKSGIEIQSFDAGEKGNIIPEEAMIRISVQAEDSIQLEKTKEKITKICARWRGELL